MGERTRDENLRLNSWRTNVSINDLAWEWRDEVAQN